MQTSHSFEYKGDSLILLLLMTSCQVLAGIRRFCGQLEFCAAMLANKFVSSYDLFICRRVTQSAELKSNEHSMVYSIAYPIGYLIRIQ